MERDKKDVYQSLFEDNNEGEGVFINPCSILRMCVQKAKAAWTGILFVTKPSDL